MCVCVCVCVRACVRASVRACRNTLSPPHVRQYTISSYTSAVVIGCSSVAGSWTWLAATLPAVALSGAAAVMGAEERPVIRGRIPQPGQRALIGPCCRMTPFNVTEISLQQLGQLATGLGRGGALGWVLQSRPPATLSESAIFIPDSFNNKYTINKYTINNKYE